MVGTPELTGSVGEAACGSHGDADTQKQAERTLLLQHSHEDESNYNTPAPLSQNQLGLSPLQAAQVLSQGSHDGPGPGFVGSRRSAARLRRWVTLLGGIMGSIIKYVVVSIPATAGRMTEQFCGESWSCDAH